MRARTRSAPVVLLLVRVGLRFSDTPPHSAQIKNYKIKLTKNGVYSIGDANHKLCEGRVSFSADMYLGFLSPDQCMHSIMVYTKEDTVAHRILAVTAGILA
jgi:hypothetical protein